MDDNRLREALDDIFDQALVFHAFTKYMRDYEVIVDRVADQHTEMPSAYLRYLFKHCVRADVSTAISPEVWRRSQDDRSTEYDSGVGLNGFVWGVNWQALYPGATIIGDSPHAQTWSEQLGIDFHEVQIETNVQTITVVFSELDVTRVAAGYSPFVADRP